MAFTSMKIRSLGLTSCRWVLFFYLNFFGRQSRLMNQYIDLQFKFDDHGFSGPALGLNCTILLATRIA
jgi:hypothetical protein